MQEKRRVLLLLLLIFVIICIIDMSFLSVNFLRGKQIFNRRMSVFVYSRK